MLPRFPTFMFRTHQLVHTRQLPVGASGRHIFRPISEMVENSRTAEKLSLRRSFQAILVAFPLKSPPAYPLLRSVPGVPIVVLPIWYRSIIFYYNSPLYSDNGRILLAKLLQPFAALYVFTAVSGTYTVHVVPFIIQNPNSIGASDIMTNDSNPVQFSQHLNRLFLGASPLTTCPWLSWFSKSQAVEYRRTYAGYTFR